mmetsp:Transcript_20143/g.37398  ORF Transcript_20143/g.37398 Transcript_20143/m.37398 type:complete len:252 (+) Transcript_20143:1876-2631(+)
MHVLVRLLVVDHDSATLHVLQHEEQVLAAVVVDDFPQLHEVGVRQALHDVDLLQQCGWNAQVLQGGRAATALHAGRRALHAVCGVSPAAKGKRLLLLEQRAPHHLDGIATGVRAEVVLHQVLRGQAYLSVSALAQSLEEVVAVHLHVLALALLLVRLLRQHAGGALREQLLAVRGWRRGVRDLLVREAAAPHLLLLDAVAEGHMLSVLLGGHAVAHGGSAERDGLVELVVRGALGVRAAVVVGGGGEVAML